MFLTVAGHAHVSLSIFFFPAASLITNVDLLVFVLLVLADRTSMVTVNPHPLKDAVEAEDVRAAIDFSLVFEWYLLLAHIAYNLLWLSF